MSVWITFALRNVMRQKKRSVMLSGAIALSVFVITVMSTLTAGMTTSLQTNFSQAFGGHLFVSGAVVSEQNSELALIEDTSTLEQALSEIEPHLASTSRRSSIQSELIFARNQLSLGIQGVDFEQETALLDALEPVAGDLETATRPGHLILSEPDAARLGVTVGESVLVKGRTLTGQQNLGEWILGAIVADTGDIGPSQGYANLADVNTLLNLPQGAYQIRTLFLNDLAVMDAAAAQLETALAQQAPIKAEEENQNPMEAMINARFGGNASVDEPWVGTRFEVSTLEDRMGEVLSLIDGLNVASALVFGIMLLITMVGINNGFRMVMVERTSEIGTLRAIGVQARQVFSLLIFEATILAALGSIVGVVLGLAGLAAIGQLTVTGIPLNLFTLQGHPVVSPSLAVLAAVLLVVGIISVAAALLPARSAARLAPADALRMTA